MSRPTEHTDERVGPLEREALTEAPHQRESDAGTTGDGLLYRELVENVNSAVLRWDRHGVLTFMNEYALELFGWRPEEVIGGPVTVLVPSNRPGESDLSHLDKAVLAAPEKYTTNVNENVTKDGRRLWIAWTNRALRDEAGEVLEILAIGNDVTELVRAQTALRQSEERYRTIVELADEDQLLRNLVESAESRAGVKVSLTLDEKSSLPPRAHEAVYRITQEALNNVVRHAKADNAWVRLESDPSSAHLVVGDDGRAFDPASVDPSHLGLKSMREHAKGSDGRLVLTSIGGEGTVVAVEWRFGAPAGSATLAEPRREGRPS